MTRKLLAENVAGADRARYSLQARMISFLTMNFSMRRNLAIGILALCGFLRVMAAEPDLVIADFEGSDYEGWEVTGEAFGPGPARGTLPNQMEVSGYEGSGLVNSFYHGDEATGTLTSPPIQVRRKHINFLIGGGGYPGRTCINLLVDGEVVRTATGPNSSPGGSETLAWHSWNVEEFAGKMAVIQIVDQRSGGWGHINVDHLVQSNLPKTAPPTEQRRTVLLERHYLNLPVRNGAPKRRMEMWIDGKMVRAFNIELAPDEPDWWAYIDIEPFHAKEALLTVDAMAAGPGGLKNIDQSDAIKGAESLYDEPLRPQFHFSQKRGWNNDPNGMVYYDGEYHLFFQHNPYGWGWGNMHWGHAVSSDAVHWNQLPDVLFPWTQAVGHCFSGSAVVDARNTAGFQTGPEKVIVAAFTDTGCGEAIAFSNDRGRSFSYFQGNPVVEHQGRDPKIIWYEPDNHWVMAVYDEKDNRRAIAFYTSPNLKDWQFQSRLDGYFECPELFELPVDGDRSNTRWVVHAADAQYAVGRFDGKTFVPEHPGKYRVHWGAYYASQTFSGTPDGRRIQIGWGRIDMTGMPFNQMMTFPCRLTLRTTAEGIRLFAKPIREIDRLHRRKLGVEATRITPESPVSIPTSGRLFDIRAEFVVHRAKSFGLLIGNTRIAYDSNQAELMGMPLKPLEDTIRMQILVDRPSLEVCGNDGRVYQTLPFQHEGPIRQIRVFTEGAPVTLNRLDIFELNSIWRRSESSAN